MRLKIGCWHWREQWHNVFIALGLHHLVFSFFLVPFIVSVKHGASALERNESLPGFLWLQTRTQMQDKFDNRQESRWKFRKAKNGIDTKQIIWKNQIKKRKRFRKGYAADELYNNDVFNSRYLTFGKQKEMEMMEFVNNKTHENRKIFEDNNIYKRNETLSYSWAIKIPTDNDSIMDKKLLNNIADRLALHHGLMNFGPIGGLQGYFYFVHNNFFNSLNSVNDNDYEKENITNFLRSHPEIEWVNHEPIQIRKKRTLEFKDQFFPSQWHLVSIELRLFLECYR